MTLRGCWKRPGTSGGQRDESGAATSKEGRACQEGIVKSRHAEEDSIAEARDQLTELVDAAKHGQPIESN